MGVMIGFVVGYVMGTRAGENAFEELKTTVTQIVGSGEFKDLVAGGMGIFQEVLKSGTKAIGAGGQLRQVA
ncbi:MAG: hypothetical protein AB1673_10360 [Actinomycetota bacterium]|jgi:hypothetical protein